MRGATPKEHKLLLKRIKGHIKLTGEGPFTWSERVIGDKTFLWKLQNKGRMPFRKTIDKINADIEKYKKAVAQEQRRRLKAQARIKVGIRRGN